MARLTTKAPKNVQNGLTLHKSCKCTPILSHFHCNSKKRDVYKVIWVITTTSSPLSLLTSKRSKTTRPEHAVIDRPLPYPTQTAKSLHSLLPIYITSLILFSLLQLNLPLH